MFFAGSDTQYDYMANGWTRHEAFADILRKHPPGKVYRDGDIVVLQVSFGYGGNTYCYRSIDDVYRPGDLVEVTVRGETKVVKVTDVGYYSEDEYPFTQVPLNSIIGPAEGDLAEKYREAVEAEQKKEDQDEQIRAEAKKLLEEARRIKSDALSELDRASEERRKAKELIAEAEKEKEEAREQTEKARQLMAEAEADAEAARKAAEETEAAGEKARIENEKLEAARKEAAKVWKRKRPETDNQIILDLRGIQDALDEDEEIYKALSGLEIQLTKVMDKAENIMEDPEESSADIRKLYDYYLPKTIAVLSQYRNLFSSGLPQKDVARLRDDVLADIKTSTDVYNNLLSDMFQVEILDLYSEMKALQLMFGVNGLLGSDFDVDRT